MLTRLFFPWRPFLLLRLPASVTRSPIFRLCCMGWSSGDGGLASRAPSGNWDNKKGVPSLSLRSISVHILAGTALGIVHLLLLGSLNFTVPGWQARDGLRVAASIGLVSRCCSMDSSLGSWDDPVSVRAQREAVKSLELQRQLSTAHLRALQMQLEPHFLFNTLNAITTLVELGRHEAAGDALPSQRDPEEHFDENHPGESSFVTGTGIHRELPRHRTGSFCGPPSCSDQCRAGRLDGLVPCFLLQPIVENAIRHGIANCENEGLVEASARREGAPLHLRVRDSGPGLSGNSEWTRHRTEEHAGAAGPLLSQCL